ncbi:hypothetical protein GW17_00055122 [Ensete ventricosum]|nr:hypothetical protein GW17_00055122 [Ensete ventricosum]
MRRRRRCPYAGGRAGRLWAGHHLRASSCSLSLYGGRVAGSCHPCGLVAARRARRRRPLWAGRSYILVFQIQMEKMKEVKRPPL